MFSWLDLEDQDAPKHILALIWTMCGFFRTNKWKFVRFYSLLYNDHVNEPSSVEEIECTWKAPPTNAAVQAIDVSILKDKGTRYAAEFRDHEGQVLAVATKNCTQCYMLQQLWRHCVSTFKSAELSLQQVMYETGTRVGKRSNAGHEIISLRNIWWMQRLLPSNCLADKLAKLAFFFFQEMYWIEELPPQAISFKKCCI